MPNIVYIATSLDGFIAKTDGSIDWLNEIPNPEQSDYGFSDFIKRIDAIIMGRKTFEKVLTFDSWPYEKLVFVLSNTLNKLPKKFLGRADIINGEVKQIINNVNQKGYKNLYIDGGFTIQSFLKEDLIDEMIITRVPVLLGNGIPLFGTSNKKLDFDHIKTEIYNNMLIKSHYKRKR